MTAYLDAIAVALVILLPFDWLAVRSYYRDMQREGLMDEAAAQFQLGAFAGLSILATFGALLGATHFVVFLPPGMPLALLAIIALGVSVPQLVWWALRRRRRFR